MGERGAAASHRLLLLGVDVLDQPVGDELGPAEPALLLVPQLHDVLLADQQLLVLDDEDRAAAAPRVGEEAELAVGDVANHGDLGGNLDGPAELAQRVDELVGVVVHADPRAVDEDLGRGGDRRRRDLAEVLRAKGGRG